MRVFILLRSLGSVMNIFYNNFKPLALFFATPKV